jgi:hypothetical protein
MATMRRFLEQQRNRIWMKALYSSAIICFFLYIIIRVFSFDFPMHWSEEVFFFFKIMFAGCFLMVLATTISAAIYKFFLKMKRYN